jgi:hypothetical protein
MSVPVELFDAALGLCLPVIGMLERQFALRISK